MHTVAIIKSIVADSGNGVAYDQISVKSIASKECAGLNGNHRIGNHQIASETRAIGKCALLDGGHGIRDGQAGQIETIHKCGVSDDGHGIIMPFVTHRFRNDQRPLCIVTVNMTYNRYGNIVVIDAIIQITDREIYWIGAVGHEQAGRIIAVASIMERPQDGIGSSVGVKLIQIAVMNTKQFTRQHVKSHFYRQINRVDYGQLCIGKIQRAKLAPRTDHISVAIHVDSQIEAIMLYRAMVLHVAGVGRVEAFQVFIGNDINQSVGRIVGHVVDV